MCRKSVKVNSSLLRSINLCFLVSHLTYIGKPITEQSQCVDSEPLHPLELVCDIKLPLPSPAVFLFASKWLWAASQQLLLFSHHCCCWCCFPFCMGNPSGDYLTLVSFTVNSFRKWLALFLLGQLLLTLLFPFFFSSCCCCSSLLFCFYLVSSCPHLTLPPIIGFLKLREG